MLLKNKGYSKRELYTAYGKLAYRRTMLAPADKRSAQALADMQKSKYVCPLDSFLQVANQQFKITARMMANIAKEAIRSTSYQRACEAISGHYGMAFSTATVRSVTDFVGRIVYGDDEHRADEARERAALPVDRRKRHRRDDDVLYIEADGAMVNTRRKGDKGSSWMECKIGLVFHDRDVRTWTTKQGERRRQITRKLVVGYIGSYKAFQYHLLAIAERYNYQYCTKVVVISDGADWISTMVKEVFPSAIHILDLSHVKEHVGAFGKWLLKDGDEASKWIDKINGMISDGKVDDVLEILKPYEGKKLPEGVSNLHTYISNHASCMDYGKYREAGYFVGSGASESANKYVMQNRMKLQGMRWNVSSGQHVLSLKARYESGCWHEVESLVCEYCSQMSASIT